MQKKHWLAILLALTLVLAVSSMVLAQDPPTAAVTITVRDADEIGAPIEGVLVEIYRHEEGNPLVGSQTTSAAGAVVFNLDKRSTGYTAVSTIGEHHLRREDHTDFWLNENDVSVAIDVFLLHPGHQSVYFEVTGPLAAWLHLHEGGHQRITGEGVDLAFPASKLEASVNGDVVLVTVTAFVVDGHWVGKLVWAAPAANQIALKYSVSNDEPDWSTVGWLTVSGMEIGSFGNGEPHNKYFWIKGYIGADTEPGQGRIIFRAEITSP